MYDCVCLGVLSLCCVCVSARVSYLCALLVFVVMFVFVLFVCVVFVLVRDVYVGRTVCLLCLCVYI